MATPGNQLIETYDPYVMANGGINTAKPVYIANDITITGTASFAGSTFTNLTTTGNTILGNAVSDTTTINGVATVTATATGIGITTPAGVATKSGTAVPATAGAIAAGAPITMFSTNISIWVTSDAPTHTATKGDLCINTGGSSSSTRLYINNGTTNWVAVTTAS